MATEIRDVTPSDDAAARRGLVPDVLPSDRETAYLLWSTTHGQNAADVARELGLPETTVRSWVTRDGWRARLDQERTEQSLRVRAMADVALMRVVPEVIEGLAKIARGAGDHRDTLDKDGNLVTVYDAVPYQARVNASNSLLDRFGLTAVRLHQHQVTATTPAPTPTHNTTTAPDPAAPLTHDQILTMTPDQIRQAPHLPPLTRETAAAMSPDQRRAWEEARRRQRQAG
ncbi:MAG: hypothetical protein M3Q71_10745 [Chloroflexota bacterium]|nr:hypothetical protein [Chloroflexota bacterium]